MTQDLWTNKQCLVNWIHLGAPLHSWQIYTAITQCVVFALGIDWINPSSVVRVWDKKCCNHCAVWTCPQYTAGNAWFILVYWHSMQQTERYTGNETGSLIKNQTTWCTAQLCPHWNVSSPYYQHLSWRSGEDARREKYQDVNIKALKRWPNCSLNIEFAEFVGKWLLPSKSNYSFGWTLMCLCMETQHIHTTYMWWEAWQL